jgi:hypothetical protein
MKSGDTTLAPHGNPAHGEGQDKRAAAGLRTEGCSINVKSMIMSNIAAPGDKRIAIPG